VSSNIVDRSAPQEGDIIALNCKSCGNFTFMKYDGPMLNRENPIVTKDLIEIFGTLQSYSCTHPGCTSTSNYTPKEVRNRHLF